MRQVWEVACILIPLVLLSAAIWGSWGPFNDQLTLLWANPPMGPEQIQPQTLTTYTGWVSESFLPRPLPSFLPKDTVEFQLPCSLLKRAGNWLYGISPHQAQ